MMHVFFRLGQCIAFLLTLSVVAVHADDIRYKTLNQVRTGVANYHVEYSKISKTLVTLQDFKLRLNDGTIFRVPTAPVQYDLQDLQGLLKGIRLQLGNVVFPLRAPTIDVVEIEMNIVRCIGSAVGVCKISTAKTLHLYTGGPIQLGHEDYLIKVGFDTLNGIQMDNVTKTVQKLSCTFNHMNLDSHRSSEECRPLGKPVRKTVRACSLANRRYPITGIVIRANEA